MLQMYSPAKDNVERENICLKIIIFSTLKPEFKNNEMLGFAWLGKKFTDIIVIHKFWWVQSLYRPAKTSIVVQDMC